MIDADDLDLLRAMFTGAKPSCSLCAYFTSNMVPWCQRFTDSPAHRNIEPAHCPGFKYGTSPWFRECLKNSPDFKREWVT